MPTRRNRCIPLAVLAAVLCGLAAPAAHANTVQISAMMDDDNLVYRSDKTSDRTLNTMKSLGVDYVRVTVLWNIVAERARSTKRADRLFRRRGAENPKAYPKGNWDRYDHLVRAAAGRGIGVYFNVTGPGPAWCCEKPPKSELENKGTWMPKAREFKLFVKAIGKRYSGKYRDENSRHTKLPRVSFWSLWNEPNQGGWLTPQWYHGRAYSPYLFRQLYFKGREGLVATGHEKDIILLGETAPIGKTDRSRSRSPMYPVTFIKSLFCVDGNGNSRSGIGCGDFSANGPMLATAYAHHPYTKDRSPLEKYPSDQAITMANLDTLTSLLDKIADHTQRIQSSIPIALTEFGYETQPPDPYHGVSLAKQAEYSNLSDLLAWANSRVLTQTQFLLKDVAPIKGVSKTSKRYWFTYQSGLFFNNGRAKPAANAYAMPFAMQPLSKTADGHIVYVAWGQARFRPNTVRDFVSVQYKAKGTSTWAALGDPMVTQTRNYFYSAIKIPGPGKVRAVWGGSQAPFIKISRVIDVS